MNWKIGISSAPEAPKTAPILLTGDVIENLRKAASLGYDAIEVHTRENVSLNYEAIGKVMDETGVRIAQIITGRLCTEGGCTLMDDAPYIMEAAIEGMKKYVDMASKVGANLVVGWVRGKVPAGGSRDKYMKRLGENLKILNDYGKERDVALNLEVINHYEINTFNTQAETLDFIEEYDLDNCFVHLDTYHMNLEEDDMVKAIKDAGNKLGYFHVADSTRWYPGSSRMDWDSIFEALDEAGYKGYVTVECFPREDNMDTAKKALEFIKTKFN